MITGSDISGQMGAGDIPNMDLRVSIRPGNCNKDIFRHGELLQWIRRLSG
jgi:hypothetical protein